MYYYIIFKNTFKNLAQRGYNTGHFVWLSLLVGLLFIILLSSPLVIFHFGRLPFWSSSILVVFHFSRLPFWSSSLLVVFHFGRFPFWSSSDKLPIVLLIVLLIVLPIVLPIV